MKRRNFIKLAAPIAAAGLFLPKCRGPITITSAAPEVKLLLRGGKSFYQNKWQNIDVGIDAAGKLRFANNPHAEETIDVRGKIIAPGFIDILADNALAPEATFPIFEKYKVSDGVSTALQMHGGSDDCAAYYQRFGRMPHLINYGVSTFVMVIRQRSGNVAARIQQIEKNLDDGALGVSHSLEYQPAPYAEVLEYAKLAKKYDRPLFLLLR